MKYDDIPGVVIHPIPPEACGSLRFEVLPAVEPTGDVARAIDLMWEDLKRARARLHDGPILLVDRKAMESGRLVVRRGTYKTLATAAHVGMDVYALGVQGVLTGRDEDGDECVLMGRRSSQVRMYAGMWENAPSGTVTPPSLPLDGGADAVDWAHVITALRQEGFEELGLDVSSSRVSWLALLVDEAARSIDVVLKLEFERRVRSRVGSCQDDGCERWEYAESGWVPRTKLLEWAERERGAFGVSPPTRALVRWMDSGG